MNKIDDVFFQAFVKFVRVIAHKLHFNDNRENPYND